MSKIVSGSIYRISSYQEGLMSYGHRSFDEPDVLLYDNRLGSLAAIVARRL